MSDTALNLLRSRAAELRERKSVKEYLDIVETIRELEKAQGPKVVFTHTSTQTGTQTGPSGKASA